MIPRSLSLQQEHRDSLEVFDVEVVLSLRVLVVEIAESAV
jgi:hypothetical protein